MRLIRLIFVVLTIPAVLGAGLPPAHATQCSAGVVLFGEALCPARALPAETGDIIPENSNTVSVLERDIWAAGLAKRFGADAFKPTEAEIETFIEQQNRAQDARHDDDRMAAELLRAALEDPAHSAEHRQEIADLLKTMEASLRLFEQRRTHNESLSDNYGFIADDAEKKLATGFLQSWKTDKALFTNFGGALTARGGQIMPLEARNKFRAWIRTEGNLQIVDPAYNDILPDEVPQPGDKTLPPDNPAYQNFYADPAWQYTQGQESHTDIVRTWLKKIKQKKEQKP